ncbi:hypothetical protein MTR67_041432 [Solanum verrucosum]|uniref:Uncharacterized protein n=1 Tax=Solanum verrucosum TaxID=315347 RepID=A0AAF0ZQB1_SOLVR|nr:hypothetical protein MTR67_041432 [Solanum verrucosum]
MVNCVNSQIRALGFDDEFIRTGEYYFDIQIHALGFDDKFIRTWENYFDYCAAGFKTRTFGDYQVYMVINLLNYVN